MYRSNDSALACHKPEELLVRIRRQWPYVAGSTCLVVLLIWQPFQPPALAVMLPVSQPGAQAIEQLPNRLGRAQQALVVGLVAPAEGGGWRRSGGMHGTVSMVARPGKKNAGKCRRG